MEDMQTDVGEGAAPEIEKKPNGNGANGTARPPIRYAGRRLALADLRKMLTPDAAKIVKNAMQHIESELIICFPQLVEGVRSSDAQASFSATLQIKSAKKNRLKGAVKARVRAPREALEIDLYLADDGQLVLGLPDDDDGDSEE